MSDDLELVNYLRTRGSDDCEEAASAIERLTAEVAAFRLADEVARKAWVKLFPMRLPTAPLVSIVTDIEAEAARLREALTRLRDCDWVITLPDRMDAVREIARAALRGEEG